jgi:hypothetical protein
LWPKIPFNNRVLLQRWIVQFCLPGKSYSKVVARMKTGFRCIGNTRGLEDWGRVGCDAVCLGSVSRRLEGTTFFRNVVEHSSTQRHNSHGCHKPYSTTRWQNCFNELHKRKF